MAAKEGIGFGKAVGIVILVVVIIGGASFAAYQYYRSGQHSSFPAFNKTGASAPLGMASIIDSAKSGQLFSAMANMTANALPKGGQLTVVYNGTASGTIGNSSASFLSYFQSPVSIRTEIYGALVRFDANISSIPVFGAADIQYLNNTNGTYVCSDFNSTAITERNYKNMLVGGHSETCSKGGSIDGFNLAPIASLNFSQMEQIGTFTYRNSYQSSYNGLNCTYISGGISSSGGENGNYQVCISDDLGIPLSMSVYMTGPEADVTFTINETELSNSASLSYINSMP